jgi:hypothetical protein
MTSSGGSVGPLCDRQLPAQPLDGLEPVVIRALFEGVRALEHRDMVSKGSPGDGQPDNRSGETWTPEEEEEALAKRFDDGASLADLAERYRRTETAVKRRSRKLGKVEE